MSDPAGEDVRSYEGRTHADAAHAFAVDAPIAAEAGLYPISQRWAAGAITAPAVASFVIGFLLIAAGSLLVRADQIGPIEAVILLTVGIVLVYVGATVGRGPGRLVVTYRRRSP